MDAGNYTEAIIAFEALDGYSDSSAKIDECKSFIYEHKKTQFIATYGQELFDKLGLVEKGAYITFGKYEQDNDTTNGSEDITWLVLEIKDGKALVISQYALDYTTYNQDYSRVSWETCTLRKWLNDNFLTSAFSDSEKTMIPAVEVSADPNLAYSEANPGNATQDQIFLLSIVEANQYFDSDSAKQCIPTTYAVKKGAQKGGDTWWLRSPGHPSLSYAGAPQLKGDYQASAAIVNSDGKIDKDGELVHWEAAVRPALWIDLTA